MIFNSRPQIINFFQIFALFLCFTVNSLSAQEMSEVPGLPDFRDVIPPSSIQTDEMSVCPPEFLQEDYGEGAQPGYGSLDPELATGLLHKKPVHAQSYIAVTADVLASQAAAKMLEWGGTAADAVIAAQLTLGLVEPQSTGLGGGAFALFYDIFFAHFSIV